MKGRRTVLIPVHENGTSRFCAAGNVIRLEFGPWWWRWWKLVTTAGRCHRIFGDGESCLLYVEKEEAGR